MSAKGDLDLHIGLTVPHPKDIKPEVKMPEAIAEKVAVSRVINTEVRERVNRETK